jgi:hypothetical protein
MASYNSAVYHRQGDGNPTYEGGGSGVFTVVGSATLAEVNAGKTVIEGVSGKQIKVVGGWLKSTGAFAALTAIEFQESDGSPVIASYAQANLTNGAVFNMRNTITGQTMGAGFMAALTAGNGVKVTKTGSDGTTATQIDYAIDFVLV